MQFRPFLIAVLLMPVLALGQNVPTDKEAAEYNADQKEQIIDQIKDLQKQLADLQKADLKTIKKQMMAEAEAAVAKKPKVDRKYELNSAGNAFNDPSVLVGMKLDDAADKLEGKAIVLGASANGAVYDLSNNVIDRNTGKTVHYSVTVDKDKVITSFTYIPQ